MKSMLLAASAVCALASASSALAQSVDAAAADVEELIVTGRGGSDAQRKVEASYAITTVSDERSSSSTTASGSPTRRTP